MQNATHIIEVGFEGALVITVFFYVVSWIAGRKLTNGQIFFLFAIGFAGLLLLDLLRPIVPDYVAIIVCLATWLLSSMRSKLLKRRHSSSKPAFSSQLTDARKPNDLRDFSGKDMVTLKRATADEPLSRFNHLN
jgi:hypothetical protein